MQRFSPLRCISIVLLLSLRVDAAAEQYYITRLPARVVPEKVVTLVAPEQGEAQILHREETAEKGTLLARINPKAAALAVREFELEKRRDTAAAQDDILLLQRQKEELEFVLKLPAEQRAYVQSKVEGKADKRALALLEEKISLRRAALELEQEKKQSLFEEKKAQAELRMPFNGRILYHIPLPESAEETLHLPSNVPVATVADDSALYLAVSLTDSELVNLPAEHIHLRLDESTGGPLQAVWHRRAVEKTDNTQQTLVYYFRVPEAAKERAWGMLGAHLVAELYYEGEDVTYIRKDELAAAAENTVYETWQDLVRAVYPGFRILFCGETHLALVPDGKE